MPNKVWDEITYPFPNFNGCKIEVWDWKTNSIPHFIIDVITHPCWNLSWSMLVKGVTGNCHQKQAFINGVPPEVTIWAAQDVALNSNITSAFKKQGPDSI